MKVSVTLIVAALAVIGAGEARSQEASIALDVDAARSSAVDQRVPAMIVQEGPIIKPAAAKPDPAAPRPIVMSGDSGSASYVEGSTGNPVYDKLVKESAARNGVDPNLMFAVMRQESGFNPRARSYKGASGLMQLMPDTARRFGVTNIWDPAQNIEGGARYLRFLLDTFKGDVKLALAGYNAGENAVIGAGYRVPRYRETQAYVQTISARYGSDKHRGASVKRVDPQAPATMVMEAGASSRLSNNY
jgi:soluble lytic murein transglycosylase-like protein